MRNNKFYGQPGCFSALKWISLPSVIPIAKSSLLDKRDYERVWTLKFKGDTEGFKVLINHAIENKVRLETAFIREVISKSLALDPTDLEVEKVNIVSTPDAPPGMRFFCYDGICIGTVTEDYQNHTITFTPKS